ncbi:hypothetical protein ppKF707_1263 [Metapseudomonas furukawaii]|uniref:Uncharacterized protein n=1 Tax=Metapseudomonas furukawaii TaxID=1149133 RepID=A0AAD1FH86_METFU|nr:hypothetical protein ppKF707_1263 [Pseudomonas furukawaii]BAU76017.1 hypothetical protein KF707C_43290 [Pseudomonas furukawaii]
MPANAVGHASPTHRRGPLRARRWVSLRSTPSYGCAVRRPAFVGAGLPANRAGPFASSLLQDPARRRKECRPGRV